MRSSRFDSIFSGDPMRRDARALRPCILARRLDSIPTPSRCGHIRCASRSDPISRFERPERPLRRLPRGFGQEAGRLPSGPRRVLDPQGGRRGGSGKQEIA
eukprot:677428-Pyramimonas_sp.AAC.1